MRHPYFDLPRPLVIGHRGAAGEAPENTLLSFERALAVGAAILESDVHLTRDGVPVLLHDERVERTTEGEGPVGELTLAELARLDAGHRFSPDGGRSFPFRGQGLRVPTLAEAFRAFPGARFNLELKEGGAPLAEAVVALVRELHREATTLLTAGEDPMMQALRSELARSGVAPAMGASAGDVLRFVRAALEGAPPPPEPAALQIPAEFAGRRLVNRELVDYAHAHDVHVHVWTVNEPGEMKALLELGVDGLVTDFPGRMVALLGARATRR
jgi:glycerophosphoryl diester phosphodiesterase